MRRKCGRKTARERERVPMFTRFPSRRNLAAGHDFARAPPPPPSSRRGQVGGDLTDAPLLSTTRNPTTPKR